jgi:hypothetical protein
MCEFGGGSEQGYRVLAREKRRGGSRLHALVAGFEKEALLQMIGKCTGSCCGRRLRLYPTAGNSGEVVYRGSSGNGGPRAR